MPARSRVLAGMAVGRAVTAERRATLLTRPQMDPLRAGLYALLALSAFRMFDGCNSVEMRTGYIGHHRLPFIRAELYVRRQPQSLPHRLPTPHA